MRGLSMQYGGVWSDIYAQLNEANELQQKTTQNYLDMKMERDLLQMQYDDLNARFKETLCSLTTTESYHLESQQILHNIHQEREALQTRIIAFETHQLWLEKQNKRLQQQVKDMRVEQDKDRDEITSLQSKVHDLAHRLAISEEGLSCRDSQIADLQTQVQQLEQDQKMLKKAVSSKNALYQSVIKERNNLQSEITRLKTTIQYPARHNRQNRHHESRLFTPKRSPETPAKETSTEAQTSEGTPGPSTDTAEVDLLHFPSSINDGTSTKTPADPATPAGVQDYASTISPATAKASPSHQRLLVPRHLDFKRLLSMPDLLDQPLPGQDDRTNPWTRMQAPVNSRQTRMAERKARTPLSRRARDDSSPTTSATATENGIDGPLLSF